MATATQFKISQFIIPNVQTKPSRVSGSLVGPPEARFIVHGIPRGVDTKSVVLEDSSTLFVSCSKVSPKSPEQHYLGRRVSLFAATSLARDNPATFKGRLVTADADLRHLCVLTDDNTLKYIVPGKNDSVIVDLDDVPGTSESVSKAVTEEVVEISLKSPVFTTINLSMNVSSWSASAAYTFHISASTIGTAGVKQRIGFSIKNRTNTTYAIEKLSYIEYRTETVVYQDRAETVVNERAYGEKRTAARLSAAPSSSSSSANIAVEDSHVSGNTAPVQINSTPVILPAHSTTHVVHVNKTYELQFYFLSEFDAGTFFDQPARINMSPVLRGLDSVTRAEILPFSGSQQFVWRSPAQSYELYTTEYDAFSDTSSRFYVKMPALQAVACVVTSKPAQTVTSMAEGTRVEFYSLAYYNMIGAPVKVKQIMIPPSGYSFSDITVNSVLGDLKFTVSKVVTKERETDFANNSRWMMEGVLPYAKAGIAGSLELIIAYRNM